MSFKAEEEKKGWKTVYTFRQACIGRMFYTCFLFGSGTYVTPSLQTCPVCVFSQSWLNHLAHRETKMLPNKNLIHYLYK